MQTDISEKWLPVYEALASEVRLKIIRLLAKKPMNVKELAESVKLSSAIMTMHVKKLEAAGIIKTEMTPCKGGVQKICTLAVNELHVNFPVSMDNERSFYETSVPVGHYTDFQVTPTCGLATMEKVIGHFDDPRYFLDPERVNAGILWFSQGFAEYKIPNYLLSTQQLQEVEVSMEICSEAPGTNENWPSDISFYINDIFVGQWTSPGDFGERRGTYTPHWWNVNNYGLLKVLRVNRLGTFMDGQQISDKNISQLDIRRKHWTFRVAVQEESSHVGGVTLFGSGFGNYDQDIVFRFYYI